MSGLTLNEYQVRALETADYEHKEYPLWGLLAEAGEVADLIAKHKRGDGPLDHHKLAKELGDLLWFVAVVAHTIIDTDLQVVGEENLKKLQDRKRRGVIRGRGDDR